MSNTRISVNIDTDVKKKAQSILNEIGMDMTTAIDSFLRTLIREERIPFDLCTQRAYRDTLYLDYINSELDKSMLEAEDPDTEWLSHDDVMKSLVRRREARNNVYT